MWRPFLYNEGNTFSEERYHVKLEERFDLSAENFVQPWQTTLKYTLPAPDVLSSHIPGYVCIVDIPQWGKEQQPSI